MSAPYYLRYCIATLMCLWPGRALYAQGIITSVAGNGITQYIGDGWPATSLSLAEPEGIWVDKQGNIYVTDYADNRIRRIDKHDTLITFAATGAPGFTGDGGPCTAATIRNPRGICMDTAGNIYFAETFNHIIRKIDIATHTITTVCGTGGVGGFSGDNGPATDARLNLPAAVVVDSAGNIYVADYYNSRVRKVDAATGMITTIAGTAFFGFYGDNGPATSARLEFPISLSLDGAGNLYVADFGNHRIRRIAAATGIITTVAGTTSSGYSGDNGPATAARLNDATGVFADRHGNLYIADNGNNRVRMVTPEGNISTVAGNGIHGYSGDGGSSLSASFNSPYSIFVDDSGILYIADALNSAVRKVVPQPAGIAQAGAGPAFAIYPNPSTGTFSLQMPCVLPGTIMEVYTINGSLIYSAAVSALQTQVSLPGVAPGICYVRLTNAAGTSTEKMVISR